VARHVAGDYRVAMIGFTPGWSYLSGLEARCICRGGKIHGC
jgi:allophanate hydrolase subunit 1